MKNLTIFILPLIFLVNCKKKPSFTHHFTTRNYYISIADSLKNNRSAAIVDAFENDINNTDYVLTTVENDWQGIVAVDKQLDLNNLKNRTLADELHHFTTDSTVRKKDTIAFKIEVTVLQPLDGNDFRFSMGVYRTADKSEWQRHLSPGIFVYKESDTSPNAIADWMKRLVVTVTFK